MPSNAVEGVVEFEPARHFLHRAAKEVNVATCIVASQVGVTDAKTCFKMVKGMSGATRAAIEHL